MLPAAAGLTSSEQHVQVFLLLWGLSNFFYSLVGLGFAFKGFVLAKQVLYHLSYTL
jgi:hypothetical protein